MNGTARKIAGAALGAALLPGAAYPVQLISNKDLTLNLGGSFEDMGELESSSNNQNAPYYVSGGNMTKPGVPRDNTRVYLFQTEDRLLLNGDLEGTKFYIEEALGGEAVSTSNNQVNLYQMYADVPVPVLPDLSVVVGQFKVPSNLSSAEDIRSLMFTETSPLFSEFFNQGYDNGVGLQDHGKGWDATLGTISGAPDLPQRYLPELFNFPPMLYTRFGVGNISDDAYQQVQAINHLKQTQWGVHLNGEYIRDSNAGHSDQIALQNSDASTVNSTTIFGNALLWSNWNPFLGKTSTGMGTSNVDEQYWNTSVDAQYRKPLSANSTFIATAQWSFAEFVNNSMLATASTDYLDTATINIQGGEFVAGLVSDTWGLAARLDTVLPSNYLIYNSSVTSSGPTAANQTKLPSYQPNQITGDKPIFELAFPSITYRINNYAKLTAETMFWFNDPQVSGDDGVYNLTEMPFESSLLFPTNGTVHNPFVVAARMGFVLAF